MADTTATPVEKRRRCVIFDFDQTLATVDVNGFGPQGVAAMGGHERVDVLDAFLERITSLGVDLGIVSFNNRSNIVKTLNTARLLKHFQSKDCYGYDEHKGNLNKSALIYSKFLKPRGIPADGIMFVDDCADNIRDLRTNPKTQGAALHHVQTREGMETADIEAVLRWCEGTDTKKRRGRP